MIIYTNGYNLSSSKKRLFRMIKKMKRVLYSKKNLNLFPNGSLWKIICKYWWLAIFGAILSFILASILITGWPAGLLPNLNYPYVYSGDGLYINSVVERIKEGWFLDNPRSGYPFGSASYDFPAFEVGNALIFKFIGFFTKGYFSTLNLYILLSFSLTFLVSFFVLRALGLAIPFSITVATLFNFQSFHFARIEGTHILISCYFVVPLYYYFGLKIFNYENMILEKMRFIKKIIIFFVLISMGLMSIYYSAFGLIVFLIIAISSVLGIYNKKILKKAIVASFLVSLGLVLNFSPSLIYKYANGINPEVAQRSPKDSEIYGFKLVQLLMPKLNHRNEVLSNISEKYFEHAPLVNENYMSSLGIIGSLGVLFLFLIIVSSLSGKNNDKNFKIISLIVITLFLFGTIGGFGTLFAFWVSPSIRGWNRISIFISFGALLGLFLWLQSKFNTHFSGRRFTIFSNLFLFFTLMLGLYDQTSPPCKKCQENVKKNFDMDKVFINTIESSLPMNSAVYQLPYFPFPETPPLYRLQDYDMFIGFLHSTTLRWSYGGIKGRSGDLFYRSLSKEPIKKQIEVVKKMGFSGIYIDRRGFQDNGEEIIRDLTILLGAYPSIKRADNEIVFFPIP